uniref:MTOR-associated protein MEAK7 n=1 Tax=Syphacia muris TaxID=451379 RepID=A0A0N5AM39_9BILA
MGGKSSKNFRDSKESKLDKDLQEAIIKQFERMTGGKPQLTFESFKAFSDRYLDTNFQKAVFQAFKKFRKDDKVTCENVLRFAELLFGGSDQLASCIILFDLKLRSVVEASVASFFICECPKEHYPVNLLVDFIMAEAPQEELGLDFTLFSKWLSKSTMLPSILMRIFNGLLLNKNQHVIPKLSNPTVLSPASIFAISLELPIKDRQNWSLLFSSAMQGESFSKLYNAVNGSGPCLIVIETDKGKIFGGFANEGFISGPHHSGDSRCFLFQDRPKIAIYSATGFNNDFAYLNYRQTSFPNGLGIGGHDNNWSFFLHDEYGLGTSCPSISTFEKCWLAGETRFKTKTIEAWRIGEPVKRKRYDSAGDEIIGEEVSVLDRDPEAKAILELTGKKSYCEPFREQKEKE